MFLLLAVMGSAFAQQQGLKGTEGPTEIRKQEQKSPEGTEVRKKVKKKKTTGAEGQKPKGFEGGDVQKKTQ